MTLGQKLRQVRLARGLSQTQVSSGCITRNMLSQIENDQAQPSMRTLEHLANVLGVSVGWLLCDEQTDAALERMRKAKTLFEAEDDAGCLALFEEEPPQSDEAQLLCSLAAARLSERRFAEEDFAQARALAGKALELNRAGLYASREVQTRAMAVLARCELRDGAREEEVSTYRAYYLARQMSVSYHLIMARHHLRQEHVQAAEREIWSIVELPEENRAEYLLLRAMIAVRREQYENAALYLHQAEELELSQALRREVYQVLEICCRELGDFKEAYLYASKQLSMPQPGT